MGWQPAFGETRRKDDARASARAQTLRVEPTASELRLWKLLRVVNREGAHLRRQAHVGALVFDVADLPLAPAPWGGGTGVA